MQLMRIRIRIKLIIRIRLRIRIKIRIRLKIRIKIRIRIRVPFDSIVKKLNKIWTKKRIRNGDTDNRAGKLE